MEERELRVSEHQEGQSILWRALASVSLLLFSSHVFGLAIGVFQLMSAFDRHRQAGKSSDEPLAEELVPDFIEAQVGMVLGLVGAVLLVLLILKSRFRERWFYFSALILSCLSFFSIPLGVICGIVILLVLHRKKHEFLGESANSS